MADIRHVAFCGGGSGGHLFPAVAIAERLLQGNTSATVSFYTSSRTVDERVMQSSGLATDRTTVVTQPMASSTGAFRFLWALIKAARLCCRCWKSDPPQIVVGLGGFASVPGVAAAWWLGIPVVLLETNTIPGRANRWLSRLASLTITGWPVEGELLSDSSPVRQMGVPVRHAFRQKREFHHSHRDELHLLILGGSQGAVRLNEIVIAALAEKTAFPEQLRITHQTGAQHLEHVRTACTDGAINAQITPFISDVAQAMADADLVVSRAGAVILAELATVGRPVILIPLESSADQHQRQNAMQLQAVGAAEIVSENDPEAGLTLRRHLTRLFNAAEERDRMTNSIRDLATLDAAQSIADLLNSMADQPTSA